jgi:ABC-type nitrate/sulfonate/bicarbonate transport system ATPase subunit
LSEEIRLEHVSYAYESAAGSIPAVEDLSFSVSPSEFLCVLGPSGCGKTTILNMMAGFIAPTTGRIVYSGGGSAGSIARGVVFQDFTQLFPWRTALRNVEFGLQLRGIGKARRKAIALEFLGLVGLDKFANAFPHELSGGMQQRVAIARALAYDPAVLLMDEPFAALDAMSRDQMQRQLTEIWQQTRKTVIYITHNISEAVYLADKVLILAPHPGTIKKQLTLDLPRPRDPLSDEFVEAQRVIMSYLDTRPRQLPSLGIVAHN